MYYLALNLRLRIDKCSIVLIKSDLFIKRILSLKRQYPFLINRLRFDQLMQLEDKDEKNFININFDKVSLTLKVVLVFD